MENDPKEKPTATPDGDERCPAIHDGQQCVLARHHDASMNATPHVWATEPDPFEWAPDVCRYCGEAIGVGIRALHLSICDTCAQKNAKVH